MINDEQKLESEEVLENNVDCDLEVKNEIMFHTRLVISDKHCILKLEEKFGYDESCG